MIVAPPLPYAFTALEPVLSQATVRYHRRKQERYVEKTNALIRRSFLESESLPVVVDYATAMVEETDALRSLDLYENATQALNHALMWASMRPPADRRTSPPPSHLESAWKDAGRSLFGSGWVWMVRDFTGALSVEATQDSEQPSRPAVMVMDLWEHAYYLDYPDAQAEYVDAWWNELADWRCLDR